MMMESIIFQEETENSMYVVCFADWIDKAESSSWFDINVGYNINIGIEDEIYGYEIFTCIENDVYISDGELFYGR